MMRAQEERQGLRDVGHAGVPAGVPAPPRPVEGFRQVRPAALGVCRVRSRLRSRR